MSTFSPVGSHATCNKSLDKLALFPLKFNFGEAGFVGNKAGFVLWGVRALHGTTIYSFLFCLFVS